MISSQWGILFRLIQALMSYQELSWHVIVLFCENAKVAYVLSIEHPHSLTFVHETTVYMGASFAQTERAIGCTKQL